MGTIEIFLKVSSENENKDQSNWEGRVKIIERTIWNLYYRVFIKSFDAGRSLL